MNVLVNGHDAVGLSRDGTIEKHVVCRIRALVEDLGRCDFLAFGKKAVHFTESGSGIDKVQPCDHGMKIYHSADLPGDGIACK